MSAEEAWESWRSRQFVSGGPDAERRAFLAGYHACEELAVSAAEKTGGQIIDVIRAVLMGCGVDPCDPQVEQVVTRCLREAGDLT